MTYANDEVLTVNSVLIYNAGEVYPVYSGIFYDIQLNLIDKFSETVEEIIPAEYQESITKLGYFPIRIEALMQHILNLHVSESPFVTIQAQNTIEGTGWIVENVLNFISKQLLPYKALRFDTCFQKVTRIDHGASFAYVGSDSEDDFYAFKETEWVNNSEMPGIQVTFLDDENRLVSMEQVEFHNTGKSQIHDNLLTPIYSNGHMLE